jgi:hypothetical protein
MNYIPEFISRGYPLHWHEMAGVKVNDFTYKSPNGLVNKKEDFSNFGVGFFIRKLYRTIPLRQRSIIKRLFT